MTTMRNVALRPPMRGIAFALLSLVTSFVRPSAEETLSCGATTFQVTFEPSRPSFGGSGSGGGGNAFGAASATTGGGTSASSSATASAAAAAAALIQGPTQTAKYTFRALPQLVAGVDVCNISATAGAASAFGTGARGDASLFAINAGHHLDGDASVVSAASAQLPAGVLDSERMIITRCDNCTICPHELPAIHRLLSRVAVELGLQSLLVIVQNVNGGTGHHSGVSSSREAERLKLTENTIAKFVFLDGEPAGQLSFCELIAEGADNDALKSFSKTSVLFVSISFIILMVISLAWLVFYYVQRFRYAHAKDRLQRRLFNAAKKALTRIPTRPVRTGDRELDTDCPVCIDPYRTGDIVRMLPCRHIFHKSCVDPWLLEHRTCPMCKSDILKAFGYHVSVNNNGSVGSGNGGGGNATGTATTGATSAGGGIGAGSRWGRAHFSGQADADDIVPPPSAGHRHAHSRRTGGGNVPTAANASRRHHHSHHHHHMLCGTAALDKEGGGATDNAAADDTRSTGSSVDEDHYPASLMVVNEMIQHHHRPDGDETSSAGKSSSSKVPQLVQVIHSGNAKGFPIIPLTVHNMAVSYPASASPAESVVIGSAADSQLGGPKNVTLTRVRTAVTRRQQPPRGHVVNLVHLRSRSLNHAQFPAAMSLYTSENADGERSCSGSGTHVCVSPQSAVDEAAAVTVGSGDGTDRRWNVTTASTPTALFRTIVSSGDGTASSAGTTGMIPITGTNSTPTIMPDALCSSRHSLPGRQPSLPTPQQLHRLSAPYNDNFPFDAYSDANVAKPAVGSDVIFPLFDEDP